MSDVGYTPVQCLLTLTQSDTPGQCLLPQLSIVEVNVEVEVRRLHPLKRQQTGPFCPPVVNNEKPVTPTLSLSSLQLSHSIPRGFLACLFTAPAVSSY
eukprot:scaffold24521_cov38-Cyclotella_meneghiniana.AAC.2